VEQLSRKEREAFIIDCWMSHDARWFTAVAMTFGLEAAIRLNRTAIHEAGRAEARRLLKRLQLPPPRSVADYLLFQEVVSDSSARSYSNIRSRRPGTMGSICASSAALPSKTSAGQGSRISTNAASYRESRDGSPALASIAS
jgi:hypothetical protein